LISCFNLRLAILKEYVIHKTIRNIITIYCTFLICNYKIINEFYRIILRIIDYYNN